MVDEQISKDETVQMPEEQISEDDTVQMPEEEPKVHFEVIYRCLRCGTHATNTELGRLPEIKCICGFRVFTKVRPPMPKTVNAI